MRGVLVLALTATAILTSGCAHVEPPSGGPEDDLPPALLVSRPDSFAVVPEWDSDVVLVFDERISEQAVETEVSVSPRTSAPVVDHGGNEIRVSLREGWEPGLIYQITVSSGVHDLFNNELGKPVTLVFSTGPAIPATLVAGSVIDRVTGNPAPEARVEAIRTTDSLVYAVRPDSAGEFAIGHIPSGEYVVRAYLDQDLNGALDALEPRDAAALFIEDSDSVRVDLRIVEPDTTGPALASAAFIDGTVELELDDYLDPSQAPEIMVEIRDPSGGLVPIAEISVGRLRAAPADTLAGPAGERLPSRSLMVRLGPDVQLDAGATYTVAVADVRNIAGLSGGGMAEFTVPDP